MAAHRITFHGCDAEWHFDVNLDDHEAALVQRLARMSEDIHDGDCEPYMTVTPITGETSND